MAVSMNWGFLFVGVLVILVHIRAPDVLKLSYRHNIFIQSPTGAAQSPKKCVSNPISGAIHVGTLVHMHMYICIYMYRTYTGT